VAIDFAHDSLAERLASFAGPEPTHVVIEGVLMYLTQAQRTELLETLRRLFPRHFVYCDLMRQSFFRRYSRDLHDRIVGLGASFTYMSESPESCSPMPATRPWPARRFPCVRPNWVGSGFHHFWSGGFLER
jgi:O-methyltransferase involved in polyketide biosynthesis